jgi:hypothetical protein
LPDCGALVPGALADVLVLPEEACLSRAGRADVRMVLVGGEPRYVDLDYAAAFGADVEHVRVEVDGRTKCLSGRLFAQLAKARVHEQRLALMPRASARATDRAREAAR